MPDRLFKPNSSELADALQALFLTLQTIQNPELVVNASFAEYLFFPISHVLQKQALGDRATEYVLRILNFLLQNAWSTSLAPEMAKQLLMLFTMLVGGPPNGKQASRGKLRLNETGAAGCEAINSLFLAISNVPALRNEFRQGIEMLPSLGHTITVLLDCAVLGEDNLETQLHSLDALQTLLSKLLTDGDVLASLMPGIVSAMTKVLGQRNGKRHYKVLVKAIELFEVTLSKVFNDDDLSLHSKKDEISADVKSFRTQSWLTASKGQVKVSLNTLVTMRSHPRSEVLGALVQFSLELLTTSLYALENCVAILIDNVVVVASLESSVSPQLTETAFFQFGVLLTQNEFIQETLKERVYDWIQSLPRLLTAHDESQGLLILGCTTTSIKLLSSFLSDQRADVDYFQELLLKTLQEALIPKTSTKLMPAVLAQTNELTGLATSTELVYTSKETSLFSELGFDFVNRALEVKLKQTLKYSGSIVKTPAGLENLLSQVHEPRDPASKLMLAWMAVNTYEGIIQSDSGEGSEWLMVDDSDAGNLPRNQKDDLTLDMYSFTSDVFAQSSTALGVVKGTERYENALLCFALQGMASIARYMGQDFKNELMDVLYPLVDFLGSPNSAVRQSAQKTITAIAQSCEYTSVRELLVENSDYILDTLSIKLNTLDFSPQGPVILSTLIKLSGIRIIPYLDDVIGSLFVILDNYHGYNMITNGVFQALESVVDETNKGYAQVLLENGSGSDQITIESRFEHTTSFETLLKQLAAKPEVPDFYDKKGVAQDDAFVAHDGKPFKAPHAEDVDSDDAAKDKDKDDDLMDFAEAGADPTTTLDNAQETELKSWASPVPRASYQLVQQIVDHADRFLTHESPALRKLLLDLTATAIPVLASNQTEFLPLVNVVWPRLVAQLDDSEVYILESVLRVIGVVCEHARDFMTTRVTGVWPKLRSLLPRRPLEFRKVRRPRFGVEQRVLEGVLGCLATMARSTRLETNTFFEILEAVAPFLPSDEDGMDPNGNYGQPSDTVPACATDLKASLSRVNADAVWFELVRINSSPTHWPVLDQKFQAPPSLFLAFAV